MPKILRCSIPFLLSLILCCNISLFVIAQESLNDVFVKGQSLSYQGYEITKVQSEKDTEAWDAILKKDGNIIARFDQGFWTDWIMDFSPKFSIIYTSSDYPVGYGMIPDDYNKDGKYEFLQTLLTFDYFDRLPHYLSPLPAVVFQYDVSTGKYVPANNRFASVLLKDIGKDISHAESFLKNVNSSSYEDSTGEYLSAVMNVLLPYLYAGEEKKGWSFYDVHYQLNDKKEMRQKIQKQLDSCVVYQYLKAHPTK
ncbi:MAG: hypothetical protein NTX88_02310 [Candidatus Atribacteria bacterium]|nr:hypothetical protein [Candidatus Atribacteria bacterium]